MNTVTLYWTDFGAITIRSRHPTTNGRQLLNVMFDGREYDMEVGPDRTEEVWITDEDGRSTIRNLLINDDIDRLARELWAQGGA